MKPSVSTVKRVLNYVGYFLETSDFYDIIRDEITMPKEAVTLAISIDATSVLLKKEGWRHASAATISTYDVDGNRIDTIYIGRMPEKNKRRIKQVLSNEVESILMNDPNGAAKTIRAARYRRSLVKKHPDIEKEIKYLQRNQKRINYFEYKQKNLPIGSGVVEAACKNLIGARLKKSGMRWSREGGQNVLNLRALILSNRWEKFWNYFLQSHFPEFLT